MSKDNHIDRLAVPRGARVWLTRSGGFWMLHADNGWKAGVASIQALERLMDGFELRWLVLDRSERIEIVKRGAKKGHRFHGNRWTGSLKKQMAGKTAEDDNHAA